MATEMETTVLTFTPADSIKSALVVLGDQQTVIKGLIGSLRNVMKDLDHQNKEIEKLRNKRSRVKTERSADALPSGITKPVAISDELSSFLNVPTGTLVPRNEVTRSVSEFVKKHELYDPANKQKFVLDDRPHAKQLRTLLGNPDVDVTYFNLQRHLKHHYIGQTEKVVKESKKKADTSAEAVSVAVVPAEVATSSVEPEKLKKKIMVKKKRSELTEEA